jgi:hypothetical protein
MSPSKSQEVPLRIIAALLRSLQIRHASVGFTEQEYRVDLKKIQARYSSEGMSFLTKTLPSICKHLQQVLADKGQFDCHRFRLEAESDGKRPRFLGALFKRVLTSEGRVLQDPDIQIVRDLVQLLILFYKYELPYSIHDERKVLNAFVQTEKDLAVTDATFNQVVVRLERGERIQDVCTPEASRIIRKARINLHRLFQSFDPYDIVPSHGPGVVSTKETLWDKFRWTDVPEKLLAVYPLDAYFYASLGHVCDAVKEMNSLGSVSHPARVILVPKDSRGPRLISCEPLYNQWIQQGLMRRIVDRVERHYLTKDSVRFTDQTANQRGALLGSRDGRYVTLDLKEASDRVSYSLVKLLFPEPLLGCLEACRSDGTRLPDGSVIPLSKYAPMGSALCFPIMALTIWSLLQAGGIDDRGQKGLYVYGDDVIVHREKAQETIRILESFGFLVNRDKSCVKGFFRESCGVEAYKGFDITPIKLKSVWTSHPSAEHYSSWIEYARSIWDRGYHVLYDYIVEQLFLLYGKLTEDTPDLRAMSLPYVPEHMRLARVRTNHHLQKRQWRVRDVSSPTLSHEINGWSMLLRHFVSAPSSSTTSCDESRAEARDLQGVKFVSPFSVRSYTQRRTSKLVWRWR